MRLTHATQCCPSSGIASAKRRHQSSDVRCFVCTILTRVAEVFAPVPGVGLLPEPRPAATSQFLRGRQRGRIRGRGYQSTGRVRVAALALEVVITGLTKTLGWKKKEERDVRDEGRERDNKGEAINRSGGARDTERRRERLFTLRFRRLPPSFPVPLSTRNKRRRRWRQHHLLGLRHNDSLPPQPSF